MKNQFQKSSNQDNLCFDYIVMKPIKSSLGKPPFMIRLGHWKFEIVPKVTPENIDYEIFKMVFVRDDIGAFEVYYDDIYLMPEDVHELIVTKLAIAFSDIFLGSPENEHPDETAFKESEMLNRITKENGSKSILEVMEDVRLNANNIWESLSA